MTDWTATPPAQWYEEVIVAERGETTYYDGYTSDPCPNVAELAPGNSKILETRLMPTEAPGEPGDILARAAFAIAGHGFAEEEFGNTEDSIHWNALVVVSGVLLLNLDETDIYDEYVEAGYVCPAGREYLVWVQQDNDGHVMVKMYGPNEGADRVSDLWMRAHDDYQTYDPAA